MPPPPNPSEIKYVYLRQPGGEIGASSVLNPKIGPLGLKAKVVGEDIAKHTSAWKGIKVNVKLIIQNREAKVELVPTATSLLIKELKEPVRDRKKKGKDDKAKEGVVFRHSGNLTMDQVYYVARQMRFKSRAKEFRGTVLEMLGTCCAIGCTVDGMRPREVQSSIKDGKIEVPSA
eukprot:Selendium_serpulae@DN5661_c0_g2_i1.p1